VVTTDDERFMTRALELARSVPNTSPNPKVGAVVARDGGIAGEGYHRGAGHPHAEADAIEGTDATGAVLYVTLEPCVHHGLTPPCAPMIVASGIVRVVIAIEDPDPRVSGRGIAYLREHGVQVQTGLLDRDAARDNAPFLHHRRTGRPLVTLKLALSLDGRLAAADGSATWITGPETRRSVHARRHEADAVMVGAGTIAADDPRLTVRAIEASRQPARIVVDSSGRTPPHAAVFGAEAPTIVATTDRAPESARRAWTETGAEVLVLPASDQGVDLRALMEELGSRDILDLYCEGGAALATSMLAEGCVDVLEVHYGPKVVGAGGPQLEDIGVKSLDDADPLEPLGVRSSGDDIIATYRFSRSA
jgi:diaminohydroxyphosphoribosylaminopyrimidine deaminase / 5-amino-6-(5-phosphoribosylamino)uracil reductase